jgi:ligand-binding SRPBCC domain-containing protein
VLLGSQRADAAALRGLQFTFAFPTLETALADIVGGASVEVRRLSSLPETRGEIGHRYLHTRRPTYELRVTTTINAPIDDTFAFFSRAENLGALTPAGMQFVIATGPPEMAEGTTIAYRMRVARVPITWGTRIIGWHPGSGFVDIQESGPYRSWWHEHVFASAGTRTVMEDRVCYAPPLGPIGRLANRVFIVPALRAIFQYRADVIRLRFG